MTGIIKVMQDVVNQQYDIVKYEVWKESSRVSNEFRFLFLVVQVEIQVYASQT